MEAALTVQAIPMRNDKFGQRYQIEFELERNGQRAIIVTAWILGSLEFSPRLTSCYIK